MLDVIKQTGIIDNVFSTDDIDKIKKLLLKQKQTEGYQTGETEQNQIKLGAKPIQLHHGADERFAGYPILMKMFRQKLQEYFGDFELVFVSWSNGINPVSIHADHHFHKRHNLPGKHYFSFIVPYSVDNDISKCGLASTVVFDDYKMYPRDDNAKEHRKTFLGHIEESKLATVKVKANNKWKHGSLIWWDSELFHSSSNFVDFETKQCLVGHTYIK